MQALHLISNKPSDENKDAARVEGKSKVQGSSLASALGKEPCA